ncbi:MAG: FtsK/SpoIIIE domain-containing protein [Acidimicrobiia bacterium]|nr:FtsK/SpoIIIE domain-containing protein [Acidimicrobiia bacterium]
MRFEVDGRAFDVDVAPDAPLGTVAALVNGEGDLLVEGLRIDPALAIGAMWDGSRLDRGGEADGQEAVIGKTGVVELVGQSGIDAGGRWRLAPGGYDLTRRGGPQVFVDDRGMVTVHRVDGSDDVYQVGVGQTFRAGGTRWLIKAPGSIERRVEPVRGRRSFNRPPRQLAKSPEQAIDVPAAPAEPAARARMGWAMLAGPALMGAIMALVFRPIMAVIALVGPLMMTIALVEDRLRLRKGRRRNAAAWAADLAVFDDALERAARNEIERRFDRHPCVPDLVRGAIEMEPVLWERRRHHPDYLRLSIGMGRTWWEPPVRSPSGGDPTVEAVIERRSLLPNGPVEVGLEAGTMIGVAGDRPGALAMVRALLLRLVTHHGPADVRLAIITGTTTDWEWCSWLPHTRLDGSSGRYRLGADPDDIESVMASLTQASEADLVVVFDGGGMDPQLRARLAALVDDGTVSAVVVEAAPVELPGSCETVVTISGAFGVLTHPAGGGTKVEFAIDGVQPDVAGLVARQLYALDDPEEASEGGRLPAGVTMQALVGLPVDTPEVIARWTDPPEGLLAALGLTENGLMALDLVADGPHGLIAGTTGSGKSELLRSLITSLAMNYGPDRVTFALIDYKGGSAFDACAALPHVLGLVTDLDRRLGKRALQSLEAELRHREEVLRAAGAEDVDSYHRLGEAAPLPRLVVIVDEFAALAGDIPEFVPSLVDIARRGRSLGVHLILATQRPAGVVGDAIRANTNLRVALRVQTVADSRDVIDDPVAARLPRRFPGRGVLRLGPGELVPFQTARISGGDRPGAGDLPIAVPVRFGWEPVAVAQEQELASSPSELERFSALASAAVRVLGWQPPRAPWAPPLPDALELGGSDRGTGVFGLVDEPDRQRVGDLVWNPGDGGLLSFGVEGSGASDAIVSCAFALALATDPGGLHIYGLDGGGGSLADLEEWPHVGGIARIADRERVVRVVRRLDSLLEDRRRGGARQSMVLVIVERLGIVLSAFDGPGDLDIREALIRVMVEGPAFGIFPFVSALRPGAVPSAVASSIGPRLCFRLADPVEYAAAGVTPRDVPDLVRGRGFDAAGRMVQVGRPSPAETRRLLDMQPNGTPPERIGILPHRVPLEALSHHPGAAGEGRFLPVGLGDRDLAPIGFRMHAGDHVLVAGPARSGRTTALASMARLAATADPDLEVVALAGPGSMLCEVAGTCCGSVDELLEAVRDRSEPTLVVIDDAERIEHPELNALLTRPRDEFYVIAAGRADALRGLYQHWTRDIRRCRLGVSLRPDPDLDGELWQTRFPRRGPSFHLPGRGYLVQGGDIEVVQVATS